MINGLQGIPGSGKSYEGTVYHVLAALKRGRKVITNLPLVVEAFAAIDPEYIDLIELRRRPAPIRGTWDANRVDDDGNGEAFRLYTEADTPAIYPVSVRPVFGSVWDYYTTWKHPETGQGPLFVIDECHVPMPRMGTDPQVVEWYKLHRHFNIDVLLMTQNFRHMCQDIADLMAMVIKVRKADILGRKNEYIRKVHAGYRGAVISDETRPYRKEFFALYKSHTQGNSVVEASADDVAPFIVRFKRWTRIMWFVVLCLVVFALVRIFGSSGKQPKTITVPRPAQTAPTPLPPSSVPAAARSDALPADSASIPEPYDTQTLHMTGHIKMGDRESYTFTVAQNGLVVNHITDADLRKSGYQFQATSDCTGVLTWNRQARAVSCNFPSQQMAAEGMDRKT